jgi:hypothetical protein
MTDRPPFAPSPGHCRISPTAPAGPVGFAAAVQLIERGLEPALFEAGASVGTEPFELRFEDGTDARDACWC